MNISEKKLTFDDIEESLNHISKTLYLKSPDMWIDFRSRVEDGILDEMVLFYAAKYNHVSILKYVMDNNILDINNESKNKNYPSIKEHLLSVAKDCKSSDFYNYLNGSSSNTNNKNCEEKTYSPVFICPYCNENIFNSGYKFFEEVSFAYSPKNNRPEEINRSKIDKVFCCNCNNLLDNITLNSLNNLCSISHCTKCGNNLMKTGINKKVKMTFNEKDKIFNKEEKTYHCSNCDKELNKHQIKYFNL